MIKQIAIDGPAGAGKSSVAKMVAQKLNYLFVDSGAMYRCIAALAIRKGLDQNDTAAWLDIALTHKIDLEDNSTIVKAGGIDLTDEIRSPEVTLATRFAANNPEIRKILVNRQRQIGQSVSIVMEGRDIGTVVLPNATCKIYLDASSSVRAKRRYDQIIAKGLSANLQEIHQAVVDRDSSDKNRKVGPLKQADDAVYLDTSDMLFDEVVDKIIAISNGQLND